MQRVLERRNEWRKGWQTAASTQCKWAWLYAITISLFILGLFYYWFALANRHVVFLYGHLGATPFDERTRSRYWMSGLVAPGALMVLYGIVNWFLGRVAGVCYRNYSPPAWPQVWLLGAMPLTLGILAVTMTCNQPVLPLATAAACVLATLSGLALATSSLAAQHLSELVWRVLAGAGLVPVFLLLRVVELPGQGLASEQTAYTVALAVAGELVNHVDRVAQKGDVADVQAEFARSLRQGVCGR